MHTSSTLPSDFVTSQFKKKLVMSADLNCMHMPYFFGTKQPYMLLGTSKESNCGSLHRKMSNVGEHPYITHFYSLSVSSLSITADNNVPYLHMNYRKNSG